MKPSNAILISVLLACGSANSAIRPEQRASLDKYMANAKGNGKDLVVVVSGVEAEAKKRIAEVEKIIRDEIPALTEETSELSRVNSEFGDAGRIIEATQFNFYANPDWVKEMRSEVKNFCCSLRQVKAPKNTGIYTKLNHDGGGNAAGYGANSIGPGGGGAGGGQGQGKGKGRGRGKGRGGN